MKIQSIAEEDSLAVPSGDIKTIQVDTETLELPKKVMDEKSSPLFDIMEDVSEDKEDKEEL